MVEVICDTSFLIHLSTNRIINIDSIEVDIGQISFLVPNVVIQELNKLEKNPSKKPAILQTMDYIKNFKTIAINGTFADKEITEFAKQNNVIVATMDGELKKKIKSLGNSVISFSRNKIVLES